MNFKRFGKVAIALSALIIARPLFAAEPEVVPGEFLVKFKTPVQQKNFKQLSTVLGGTILRQVPNTNIVVLKRTVLENAIKTAKALSKIEGIELVLKHLSYRINHGIFLNESVPMFLQSEKSIEEDFLEFFEDLIKDAKAFK